MSPPPTARARSTSRAERPAGGGEKSPLAHARRRARGSPRAARRRRARPCRARARSRLVAAVVGVGDLEVAGLDRERVVLAQQTEPAPRRRRAGRAPACPRGSGGPSPGSGRSRRSRSASKRCARPVERDLASPRPPPSPARRARWPTCQPPVPALSTSTSLAEPGLAQLVAHHALGRGRAADVAEADEEDPHARQADEAGAGAGRLSASRCTAAIRRPIATFIPPTTTGPLSGIVGVVSTR